MWRPIIALGVLCVAGESVQPADRQAPAEQATIGLKTRMPTAEEIKRYGLKQLVGRPNGLHVTEVAQGGPADRAGLKVGDVLLALDANRLYSADDLEDFLRVSKPDAKVRATLKRGTQEEVVVLTLGAAAAAKDVFVWQYAGPAQLEAALAAAKKDGKLLLVGLSGADT